MDAVQTRQQQFLHQQIVLSQDVERSLLAKIDGVGQRIDEALGAKVCPLCSLVSFHIFFDQLPP